MTSVERVQSGARNTWRVRVAFLDRHDVVVAVAVDVAHVALVGDVGVVEDDLLEVQFRPGPEGSKSPDHQGVARVHPFHEK